MRFPFSNSRFNNNRKNHAGGFSPCLLACLLWCLTNFVQAQTDDAVLPLEGQLTQGALLMGTLPKGTQLFKDDTEIPVHRDGRFVFGLAFDAADTFTLRWHTPGQPPKRQKYQVKMREYKTERVDGVPPETVSPPESVLQRIREEAAQVARARDHFDWRTQFADGFYRPAQGRISGVYGSHRILNGVPKRPHYGLDIAAPTGSPVYAPAAGIVRLAHADMFYSGGTLIIDHGMGVTSTYIHLSELTVEPGQIVARGDLIARIGATGRATGPHLDWRLNWKNVRLDPELVMLSELANSR